MEVENDISASERNLQNKNFSQLSVHCRRNTVNSVRIENCSKGVPCEIINIPYVTTCPVPNADNSQNTLYTMDDKLDENVLVSNSINSNHTKDYPKKRQVHDDFSMANLEKNLLLHCEFNLDDQETFIEHNMDYNDLATDSSINDATSSSRIVESNFATENLVQPIQFELTSPGTVRSNSYITNSTITSQTNIASDVSFRLQKEIEITPEQFSNSSDGNLHENVDLEQISDDMSAFEIILDEIENEGFQCEPLATETNGPKQRRVSELMLQKSCRNHLQDNATTSNADTETKKCNNPPSINKEALKKIEKGNSSCVGSNLKRRGHSNGDLLVRKNSRSKLRTKTPKYSVMSKNRVKNNINKLGPNTSMQTFIKDTMKDIYPDLYLKNAIGTCLDAFLSDILHRIGDEAETLVTLSSKKILDKRVLKYAIKLSLEKMKSEADVIAGKRNQWLF